MKANGFLTQKFEPKRLELKAECRRLIFQPGQKLKLSTRALLRDFPFPESLVRKSKGWQSYFYRKKRSRANKINSIVLVIYLWRSGDRRSLPEWTKLRLCNVSWQIGILNIFFLFVASQLIYEFALKKKINKLILLFRSQKS